MREFRTDLFRIIALFRRVGSCVGCITNEFSRKPIDYRHAGTCVDVVVDIRFGSPTFGQHIAVELSDRNREILYVPIGFAHGFAVLSDSALFHYKCSDYYCPEGEKGILWNDPDLGIDWPIDAPVISERMLGCHGFEMFPRWT